MNLRKRIMNLCIVLCMIVLFAPINVSAASVSSDQKKVSNKADYFVYMVLSKTQLKVNDTYSYEHMVTKKEFLAQLKKVYNGKLGARQKAVIAASQTKVSKWVSPTSIEPEEIGYKSLSKVKKEYKKLFGTSKTSVDLPSVKYPTQINKYYFQYAKKGSTVYGLSYGAEDDYSSSFVSAKKNGSTYTITKKYKYYSHWGIKDRGEKPTQTITVKINLKKKASSPYKYIITGISFS